VAHEGDPGAVAREDLGPLVAVTGRSWRLTPSGSPSPFSTCSCFPYSTMAASKGSPRKPQTVSIVAAGALTISS
jgi:hypothetical protein